MCFWFTLVEVADAQLTVSMIKVLLANCSFGSLFKSLFDLYVVVQVNFSVVSILRVLFA